MIRVILTAFLSVAIVGCCPRAQRAIHADDWREWNTPLSAGERLRIRVPHQMVAPDEVMIDRDGAIKMPLLGKVKVAGLMPNEAARLVSDLYVDRGFYLANPNFIFERLD